MLEKIHYIHFAKNNIAIGYENETLRIRKEGEDLYGLVAFLGFLCPALDAESIKINEAMELQMQLYHQLFGKVEEVVEHELLKFKEAVTKRYC